MTIRVDPTVKLIVKIHFLLKIDLLIIVIEDLHVIGVREDSHD